MSQRSIVNPVHFYHSTPLQEKATVAAFCPGIRLKMDNGFPSSRASELVNLLG